MHVAATGKSSGSILRNREEAARRFAYSSVSRNNPPPADPPCLGGVNKKERDSLFFYPLPARTASTAVKIFLAQPRAIFRPLPLFEVFITKRALQITERWGAYFEGGASSPSNFLSLTLQENPYKSESLTPKQEEDKRGFRQEEEDDGGTCGKSVEFSLLWTSESCFTYVITPQPYIQIVFFCCFFFSNSLKHIQNQPNHCRWNAGHAVYELKEMCGGK